MTTLSKLNPMFLFHDNMQNLTDDSDYKYIDILLTRYPDRTSKLLQVITGCYFTHASIGMGDTTGTFYSLVTKGFRLEQPYRHPTFKGREVPCRLYHLKVSGETYEEIKQTLEYHLEQSQKYKYSYFGVLLCVLRISLKRKNRYFCSQFVSEVLEHTRAAKLKKRSALYLPDDFIGEKDLTLLFNGILRDLIAARAAFVSAYAINSQRRVLI